jgi:hypothetical protein
MGDNASYPQLTDQELKERIKTTQERVDALGAGRDSDLAEIDAMRGELVDRLRKRDLARPLDPPDFPGDPGGPSGVREPRRPRPNGGAGASAIPID